MPFQERGADGKNVVPQEVADIGAYRYHPLLASLAMDKDIAAVKVDIGEPDSGSLGTPYGRIVQKLQDDPVSIALVSVAVRSGQEFSYIRLVQDGTGKIPGGLGELEPASWVAHEVIMLGEIPGKRLDDGKPFLLGTYGQRLSFGGEGKGNLFPVLFQQVKGQLLDAGYSLLREIRGEHLEAAL